MNNTQTENWTFCILIYRGCTWYRMDGTWTGLEVARSVAKAFNYAYRCQDFQVFNTLHKCAEEAARTEAW